VPEVGDAQGLDVRRYLTALRRRRAILAATVVGMVATVLVLSLTRPPVYEGKAQLLLQPRQTESLFQSDRADRDIEPELAIATEIQILKGDPVQTEVSEKLGPVPEVGASRVADTFVVEVRARSRNPQRAATIANTYAETFVDLRRQQAAEDLLAAGRELKTKMSEVQAEIDQIDARVADSPPPQRDAVRSRSDARRNALTDQLALFQQRLDELEVRAALASGGAQIVARSPVPTSPVEPKPLRNAVVALFFSLLLGLTLVCLLEYLDDSVTNRDDLAAVALGLPVLGEIPLVRGWAKKGRGLILSADEEDRAAAEAYRSLRTSVQMLGVERPYRTIQFTSSVSAEGKSTTVSNLGVVLARAGQRVLIVDCDLRSPRQHEFFEVDNTVGFTSVLASGVRLEDALRPVGAADRRLALLPSGPIPPNPSEMLASKRTAELLYRLQEHFDVVLIDSPPVLPVTDAVALSTWVDAVVLVAAAGTTTRKPLGNTVDHLRQVGAPLVGVVLNQASLGLTYGYGYGYGDDHGRSRKRRRALRRRSLERRPERDQQREDGETSVGAGAAADGKA
jgi:non-specific protein-tyrosine kinase